MNSTFGTCRTGTAHRKPKKNEKGHQDPEQRTNEEFGYGFLRSTEETGDKDGCYSSGKLLVSMPSLRGKHPVDVAVGTMDEISIRDAELYAVFERLIGGDTNG